MPAATDRAILPEPPDDLKAVSGRLSARLAGRIAESGPMPFRDWMEAALYEPGLGYYSAGLAKIGSGGDFITAPEIGTLFGRCIAAQLRQVADSWPEDVTSWRLLEVGGGTGRLARQLFEALEDRPGFAGLDILERSADLRDRQREALADLGGDNGRRIRWLDEPPTAPWNGAIVANEVIDAFPVDRFRWSEDGVQEAVVDWRDERFTWAARSAPDSLARRVHAIVDGLSEPLPEGYVSEVCPSLGAWFGGLTEHLRHGVVLLVDYGYPRGEYYLPERSDGTLVCHYRHRAHGDPFWWPGLQDISAFVDFTAVAEAGVGAGLDLAGYTSQGQFVLGAGLSEPHAFESADEGTHKAMAAEIRHLTLPGNMGEKFGVIAFTRGLPEELADDLCGFRMRDLRHRL